MKFDKIMDLIVDIRSHDEPVHRYIGNPRILPNCYALEVNFSGIEDRNREYWYSLGFAPAFVFPEDDQFMFSSCPVDGCRGAYSPKAEYENSRDDSYDEEYFELYDPSMI